MPCRATAVTPLLCTAARRADAAPLQGNLRSTASEAHTVVLQLAGITGVPSTGLESVRSPCGHLRPVLRRVARAALVFLPNCRPGPRGVWPGVTSYSLQFKVAATQTSTSAAPEHARKPCMHDYQAPASVLA
jgi:hypothetical protein